MTEPDSLANALKQSWESRTRQRLENVNPDAVTTVDVHNLFSLPEWIQADRMTERLYGFLQGHGYMPENEGK
jgi:hypothetical protein